jgi:anti-anti-sigma factor
MENIPCWILKHGSTGWTQEDEARCAECPYYAALNRQGVAVRLDGGGAAVIECSGTLNMLRTSALGEIADKLKAQGKNKIILNLSAVTNIYSCAMGMLVKLHRQCEELGGQFIMVGAAGYVKIAINTVSLDKLIKSADTVEGAVAAMDGFIPSGGCQPPQHK